MFRPAGDDTACLKAKAAETRSLLNVVIELCNVVYDGSDHHEHRKRMLESLSHIYNIFLKSDMFLTESAADLVMSRRCWS